MAGSVQENRKSRDKKMFNFFERLHRQQQQKRNERKNFK